MTLRLVALDMGYGHLRAAYALAPVLKTEVLQADRAPLAGDGEQRLWALTRFLYEALSRASQLPGGGPFLRALDGLTDIPPLDGRDLSTPTGALRAFDGAMRLGLGHGLVSHMRRTGDSLLATIYAPALAADRAGLDRVACVVTDTDINRIWAPLDARRTRILYLAPGEQAERRLRAYGVPGERIRVTGFPLPHELVGGPGREAARANLAARLARLGGGGEPPLVTFAVGGAGAQTDIAKGALASLAAPLRAGRLRLTLVAGVRGEVAARFRRWLAALGLDGVVNVLHAASHDEYFARFNALLARSDALWTKPSEMTFFAALGLPLVLTPPVGVHEHCNRSWAEEAGAARDQGPPGDAGRWLVEAIEGGELARLAQAGFDRLPSVGAYRIAEEIASWE